MSAPGRMRQEETRFVHEDYQSVMAIPYDMPIIGYGNNVVNTLDDLGCGAKTVPLSWMRLTRVIIKKAVEQQNLAQKSG